MDKEPITLASLEKLKKELIFLKEKKRPEIVAAIDECPTIVNAELLKSKRRW